jgi:hypothetical protein
MTEALSSGTVVGTLPFAGDSISLAKLDRDTIRLFVGVGAADFAEIPFGDDYTVFIDNR